MKQRQEGRGCETLEKRALQGPGTKAQAHLRRSGQTRGKRQLVDAVCQTGSDCAEAERDLLHFTIRIITHASSEAYRERVSEVPALPSEALLRFPGSAWLASSLSVNNLLLYHQKFVVLHLRLACSYSIT